MKWIKITKDVFAQNHIICKSEDVLDLDLKNLCDLSGWGFPRFTFSIKYYVCSIGSNKFQLLISKPGGNWHIYCDSEKHCKLVAEDIRKKIAKNLLKFAKKI